MTDARTFQAAGETPVTLPPSDPPVDPVDPVDAVDAVDAVDPEATAKAVLEYARRLLTEGDFPGADERIEAAKQLSPTDKDPWYLSGRSLLSQGNPEGALAAFEQGLALAPSDVFDPINDDLTEWQITAFRSLGRFDEASAIIEPLLERGCDNVRLINEAGWLAFDKKDVREAFAFFADSLTIDPANADAARMASNILRDYGRLSSARKTLHAALDSGADSSLWQELGDLAFLDKRYEEAAAAYEKLGPAGAKNRRRAKRMSLHLPPIRALRRRIEGRSEAAFTALEPRLERVDGELDTEERRREVRRAVADQWRQRTAAMALSDVINTVLAWLYVALGLGIAFAVAKILYHRNAFNFSIVEWGAVSLLYAAVIAVSMALLCLPVICLNDNFLGYSVLGGVSLVFGFLAWLTSRGEIRGVAGVVHFSVEAGLVAGVGLFWLFVFMNYLSDLPGPILEERLESKNPYCALVSRWLDVLENLPPDTWPYDLNWRGERAKELERIARTLERHVAKASGSGDIRTDAWMAERGIGMAAAVRELKKGILSPRWETIGWLHDEIGRSFGFTVRGQWGLLAWTDPGEAVAGRKKLRVRSFLRTAVIALLPLVAFQILQKTQSMRMHDPTGSRVQVAVYGWAVLSILVSFDPQFYDKFNVLRGAASTANEWRTKAASKGED